MRLITLPRVLLEIGEDLGITWRRRNDIYEIEDDLPIYTPTRDPEDYFLRRRLPIYPVRSELPYAKAVAPRDFRFDREYPEFETMPAVSYGVRRSGQGHIIIRRPREKRRAEENRRRKDHKLYGRYWRMYQSFVTKTYGRYSELAELADAFRLNYDDPVGLISTLATNEAIDHAYGRRARFLRDKIYSRSWYPFPVGIDTIASRIPD